MEGAFSLGRCGAGPGHTGGAAHSVLSAITEDRCVNVATQLQENLKSS